MSSSSMRTTLNFEDDKTKVLLSKLDIVYFLERDIEENNYSEDQINTIFNEYYSQIAELKKKRKLNRKQFNFYVEGITRKMFRGGFIPSLFYLDNSRERTTFDFKGTGESLAYFKLWQEYYKSKVTKETIWSYVIKIGSFLGIILAIIKLYEILFD